MAQRPLTEQEQEAWELYCDEFGVAPTWDRLNLADQLYWRMKANRDRIDRMQPWRHP